MITNVANSIPPDLKGALQAIGILMFLLATLDNYLLIRYGGKPNRGFAIWKQPLNIGEKSFLEDLKEDIVDEKEKQYVFRTIIKRDFIMKTGNKVLLRFNHMGQRTSWPLVGYVDLSLPEPQMEYRLSLLMLILTVLIMLINIITFVVLILAFILSWFFEAGNLRKYLSEKSVFYLARKIYPRSKRTS